MVPSNNEMQSGWIRILNGLWDIDAFSELSYADFEGSLFKKCLITFLYSKDIEVILNPNRYLHLH